MNIADSPDLCPPSTYMKTTTRKGCSRLSWISPLPACYGQDTCKPVPLHAPQGIPGRCAVATRHMVICLYRHAHPADHVSRRILTGYSPHGDLLRVGCHSLICWAPTRHRHHPNQRCTGYDLALRPIDTRRIPDTCIMRIRFCADACSFVRHCLRGPAYVSYRRSASYSTAGEWLRPFEPRKGQRQGTR